MRYIHRDGDDSIMFGRYLEALATYRAQLPEGVARYEIRGKQEQRGWHDSFHGVTC
jgi:hypothetical protein